MFTHKRVRKFINKVKRHLTPQQHTAGNYGKPTCSERCDEKNCGESGRWEKTGVRAMLSPCVDLFCTRCYGLVGGKKNQLPSYREEVLTAVLLELGCVEESYETYGEEGRSIISGTHNGASKVAGQGLTGRLGVRLPTPLSGVRVPNERLPLLAEPRFLAPSPKILNRGLDRWALGLDSPPSHQVPQLPRAATARRTVVGFPERARNNGGTPKCSLAPSKNIPPCNTAEKPLNHTPPTSIESFQE
ncbi:hypothetical protein KOW79_021187 [Hemibagrus wyckioides]|uniref:Uncharacterized protein n=1 Tax=Hemibagrus wyckioides TaxID=337641 RepID=A0A9D3N325_9TELE|nr:hypothetical protein KOW79_021187 [Hemibagrus wyckioides]